MRANQNEITRAVAVLRAGGLVAFPTETVYGLGADASNVEAVRKLYEAKRRPLDHPVIVHLADASQFSQWAREIPDSAQTLAQHFLPGPLTMLFKRQPHVGDFITGGQDTVGLRVPAHPVAQALLKTFNAGIAAPSANRFGHVSPTTAAHVRQELGDDVDVILDGGQSEVGIESTILDVTRTMPAILRPGKITATEIAHVLGVEPALLSFNAGIEQSTPRVSGALPAHYAPHTPLRLMPASRLLQEAQQAVQQNKRVAVLARTVLRPAQSHFFWLVAPDDHAGYAHALYANLRQLDDAQCDLMLVEQPPQTAEWVAINDRLKRAAANTKASN